MSEPSGGLAAQWDPLSDTIQLINVSHFTPFRCISPFNICKCAVFLCQLSGRATPTFTRMRRERRVMLDLIVISKKQVALVKIWNDLHHFPLAKKTITIELPVRLFHFNICSISVSRVPWRTSPAAPGRRCTSYTSGDVPADQQRNGSCLDSWCPAAIFCWLLMLLSLLNCWESFELWSTMGMLCMLNIWKSTHRKKHSHEGHLWIKDIWVSFLPFSQPEVPQPEWSAAQNDMWSENTAPDSSGFISAKGC